MTGGVGFGGHGRNSYKGNRELLKKRSSLKDNPYSARNKYKRDDNDNVEELLEWKRLKAKREMRIQNLIRLVIVVIILISIFVYLYF